MRIQSAGLAACVLLMGAGALWAAEAAAAPAAEVTLKGTLECAKCALHETEKCQNALVTEKNGKKTTYYLEQNDVSKKFHDNVCKDTKKVTVTGVAKKGDNGKREFVASKIEEVK